MRQTYWWHDKFRPRKPRYFNRVKTGYDWNKYNQTHYDHDNPPPKTVQVRRRDEDVPLVPALILPCCSCWVLAVMSSNALTPVQVAPEMARVHNRHVMSAITPDHLPRTYYRCSHFPLVLFSSPPRQTRSRSFSSSSPPSTRPLSETTAAHRDTSSTCSTRTLSTARIPPSTTWRRRIIPVSLSSASTPVPRHVSCVMCHVVSVSLWWVLQLRVVLPPIYLPTPGNLLTTFASPAPSVWCPYPTINIRSSTASGSTDARGGSAVSSRGVFFLCTSTSRASGTASRCDFVLFCSTCHLSILGVSSRLRNLNVLSTSCVQGLVCGRRQG